MKTKEKGEVLSGLLALFIILIASIFLIAGLVSLLHQADLTIAQDHNQILNLTHSLAQQKAQITNLTNLLNFNESQVIFNKVISIGPSSIISTCNTYVCYNYTSEANITLHFTFAHAGYIVINTTGQNYIFLVMVQNYSKTWFGINNTVVIGNFNYSVNSLTMPVLPGSASLRLFYYNATAPYESRLTITYYS